MREPKKNVQRAEEIKENLSENETPNAPSGPIREQQQETQAETKQQIPIDDRIAFLEMQIQQANKNFQAIDQFMQKMNPLIDLSAKIKEQQDNPAPAAPNKMGGLGGFADFLPLIGQFIQPQAQSADSEFAALGKELIKEQIGMSRAITNAVISDITSRATKNVSASIAGA